MRHISSYDPRAVQSAEAADIQDRLAGGPFGNRYKGCVAALGKGCDCEGCTAQRMVGGLNGLGDPVMIIEGLGKTR